MNTRALGFLVVLSLATSAAIASDGTLNWVYQSIGFQAGPSSLGPQTAVAMRDGRAWPVVFSQSPYNSVNAYSLYPMWNPAFPSYSNYWHQIGTSILANSSGMGVLSAATSSDGRVGAVVRYPGTSSSYVSAATVGSSSTGFSSAMPGVLAIDFNSAGGLVKGTDCTLPVLSGNFPTGGKLVDIAVSPMGDLGALDDKGVYYQKSPLTNWAGVNFQLAAGLPPSPCADLAMDSLGRPHFVTTTTSNVLVVEDFDIINGWTTSTLASSTAPILATMAADNRGGVGAAWVEPAAGTNAPRLVYAYNDNDNVTDWAIHSVAMSNESGWSTLPLKQRVGLAFDANNYPVISFVGASNQIWLAYDPVTVPEPSSLLLLVIGGLTTLLVVAKSQWHR